MTIQATETPEQVGKFSGIMGECTEQAPLTFLVFAIFCLTLLPRLLSYGMFLDGVTYAAIARNMAQGFGSLWCPYYTDVIYPQFYDHPPLGFILQSVAFRIWGNSLRVEAFWGLGTGLIIFMLIYLIWRKNNDNTGVQAGAWLPLLLFATLPMTSWLLANNMLEGTMTVFSTLASLLAIGSLKAIAKTRTALSAFFSGTAILCAVLTKGPVGFFPFAIPAIWLITTEQKKQWWRSVFVTAIMLLGFLIPFMLMTLYENEFLKSLSLYYSQQIVASVSGAREKGTNNFWIMFVVLREIIIPVIIGTIAWGLFKLKGIVNNKLSFGKMFWFYFFIALSGSLPIVLSPKQLGWYIFPSFPFYALAAAALFEKPFAHLQYILIKAKRGITTVWVVAAVIFVGAIGWMFVANGQLKRQKEFHHDFSVQALNIPDRQVISVYPHDLMHDWELVANMQRQFGASLSATPGHNYLLTMIEWRNYIDSMHKYRKIHPPKPRRYILYIRQNVVGK